jgi:hypothetical protein
MRQIGYLYAPCCDEKMKGQISNVGVKAQAKLDKTITKKKNKKQSV